MKCLVAAAFLSLCPFVSAHGGHDHSGPESGETIQQYAQRHMASEHHIEAFDLNSFFQLHDLNRDGFWDKEEIEAIYGVHHIYSQKKSKDDIEHQQKAETIVNKVLSLLDINKDGKITAKEFEAVGLDGLPNFDNLGAEGHHYDVESEFFLHHEEKYHSTPETQTDESYTHPEDIEHFAMHEEIEHKEAEKEAQYQGITVEEAIKQHEHVEHAEGDPNQHDQQVLQQDGQHEEQQTEHEPPPRTVNRVTPPEKQEPEVKYKDAAKMKERLAEWGTGDGGYKTPQNPTDKLRKNLPYKYKFKRNWGDF